VGSEKKEDGGRKWKVREAGWRLPLVGGMIKNKGLELGTEKRENVGLGIEKREDRYLRRDIRSGNMEVKVRSGMMENTG
jgi:hypothetical protein